VAVVARSECGAILRELPGQDRRKLGRQRSTNLVFHMPSLSPVNGIFLKTPGEDNGFYLSRAVQATQTVARYLQW
jgi:hypothetical protein